MEENGLGLLITIVLVDLLSIVNIHDTPSFGSAANLTLAVVLFQISIYIKSKYQVRFCWFSAEEISLLSLIFYVKQVKPSTIIYTDRIKTRDQCDLYASFLGPDSYYIPNIAQDPCYHKSCDTIWNINVFAYEKMIKAAAYFIESLVYMDNLKRMALPNRKN
ncbi:unnamed protein product [Rotaria sp. Silwood1]|nr:unnamed protein product [Rotaria sp. Silwood1]